MNKLFASSIGRKLLVALSGMFLILFLVVHLSINLLLIFDDSGALFNKGAHFMATNPMVGVMEPLLAVGFVVHIMYATIVTIRNYRARPNGYLKNLPSANSSWESRNMFVLGGIILFFLILHLNHFFVKMKFTGDPLLTTVIIDGVAMKNSYLLVSSLFKENFWYSIGYMIWAVFLGFHLVHGFWSAFQTVGLNNEVWIQRLQNVSIIYATIIAAGFCIIPLYFIIFF